MLPGSTLLSLQGALQGHCPKQALHFMHFQGLSHSGSRVLCKDTDSVGCAFLCLSQGLSSSGDQVFGEWTVSCGPCVLITSPVPATWFPPCAVCLLWGADLRLQLSWQMSTIQDPRETWLATGSLLTVWWRMAVSGARIGAAPCHLALAVHACLSDSTGGEGPVRRRLALLCY